jgi:hypothetical protein
VFPAGEKGAAHMLQQRFAASQHAPSAARMARRWKAPRARERRISSRSSGASGPSRLCATCSRARRWRHRPLPTSLRTGKRPLPATRGARSDRGRGKVSSASNRGGERRDSVSRPLTLRDFGGCPRFEGKPSIEPDSRPHHGSGGRDVRAVLGRARGNIHLQKSDERTRPGRRPRRASEQGSSRCFRTAMNTCGGCPRRPAGAALRTGPERVPVRSRSMEGTSGPGGPAH